MSQGTILSLLKILNKIFKKTLKNKNNKFIIRDHTIRHPIFFSHNSRQRKETSINSITDALFRISKLKQSNCLKIFYKNMKPLSRYLVDELAGQEPSAPHTNFLKKIDEIKNIRFDFFTHQSCFGVFITNICHF